MRILRNAAIGLAAAVIIVVIALILVVRTEGFREYVRRKLIASVEEGTGGRVEIGSFSFDWRHLRAVVTDFVVHGNEPANAAPYIRAKRVEVDVRLLTGWRHLLNVAYLGVDRPQANVLVFPDGSTNIPKPRQISNSKTTSLETIVDLAVGRFDLANGSVTFNSRKETFDLRGDDLRAQLWYDVLKQGYKGQISMAPLYVVSGRNTPVKFSITLPVTLERDRISFRGGRIATDASQVAIDGAIENLRDPKTTAHIQGRVALADLKNAANVQMAAPRRGVPSSVELDVNATVADNAIDVAGARVTFGGSNIEASGRLQDPAGNGQLQFRSRLALGELGRLVEMEERPEGTILLNGTAKLDAQRNYDVLGNLDATGVSFQQGARRIGGASLVTAAHLTPRRLDLEGFRLGAFGAEIGGNAVLEDFARYKVEGNLRRLDLAALARGLGRNDTGYAGTVSGSLAASGDLRAAGTSSLAAQARLSIAPGQRGIPVSGRLAANYRGDTDNLDVTDSCLALPHTRLTVNGSLGNRLNVALTTRDFRDFSPALGGAPSVVLAGGQASFAGTLTGRLTSPEIAGRVAMDRFAVEGRLFDSLAADVAASDSRAALTGGNLQRGTMRAQFTAAVGLRNWKATPSQPLSVEASVRGGDLADVLALAGTAPTGYSGALSADVSESGTVGNPLGAANFTVANGNLRGEPFDSLQARVSLSDQLVTVPAAQITSGQARIDLTAEFHHPRDSFERGQVHAHIGSSQVDLARLRTAQNLRPNTAGTVQMNADITGELRAAAAGGGTEFVATNVTGDASGRGLRVEGQNYGDFTATARTSGRAVSYTVSSDFAGSQIRVNGNTQLAPGYRTTADANVSGLPIDRTLLLLKRTDIPATGTLTATAHIAGTVDHPEGSLDATVDRGSVYGEPIDRAQVRLSYVATSVDVTHLEIRAGPSSIEASARYDHPAGVWGSGELHFRIDNGHVDLARLRSVQKLRPGIAGTLQLTANGAATIRNAEPRVLARDLSVDLGAKGLAAQGKNLGDLTLTAKTSGGRVNFALDSSLGGAAIQGRGDAQLSGDYPTQAQVTFHNVTWKGLRPLLGSFASEPQDFDAAADGQMTVDGPVLRTGDLRARMELSKAQLSVAAPGKASVSTTIENQGTVVLALDHGMARIESLHLTGPQTDVQARGSASLEAQTIEATVSAHTDLSLIQRFDREVVSSGQIAADATVRGSFAEPLVNGKLELHNVSVNYMDVPTGIANANGTIQFNGTSASFQNITAEVGGGKLTLGGFLSYTGAMRFALRANASDVRLRLQPGVSAMANADLRLTGRRDTSVLSGLVTVVGLNYAPESDFGSILSRVAPPVQAPTSPSPILNGMKLDVQARTSSAMAVQASVAQNLQVDANLHIQGTAARPGVVGRVSITEGRLVFFSTSYQVNTGTISFFNPNRIDPVLNLSLETQAKGADVTLRVTGPIDNMKLSYTSEPPLQFQEIVGLLAAGQAPTSDPTLLANQPAQPPQTFAQMGESKLVGTTLADPLANRLQRVFGVTQLKIDPTFVSGSDVPQAQLTLQQRVASNITFTYVTVLDNQNPALSAEWEISPQWSAKAIRDQYGLFSVKLNYKRQFR